MCLKKAFRKLRVSLCGIFCLHSVAVACKSDSLGQGWTRKETEKMASE
ncbi:DUF6783 domain-containing protein [Fusicatenibacter sp.]